MRPTFGKSLFASTAVHGVAMVAAIGLFVLPQVAAKGESQRREYLLEVAQQEVPERIPTVQPEAPLELEVPDEETLPEVLELAPASEPFAEQDFSRPELEPWPVARMTRPLGRVEQLPVIELPVELPVELQADSADVPEPEPATQVPVGEPEPEEFKPVPVHHPRPRYPQRALDLRLEGAVVCRITVAVDGTVVDVALEESSGSPLLDRAALRGVQGWRFEPGTLSGQAVQMDLSWRLLFSLN